LGNTSNGIQDIFANNVYATNITAHQVTADELCANTSGGTAVCITGDQLAAILAATGQTSSTQPSGQGSGSVGEQATSSETPPVIQVNGDNPAIVQVGANYNDLGATITGPQADLNLGITTYLNGQPETPINLDTSEPATDTIQYVATDATGVTSTSTRTVIVAAPSDPAATSTSS